MNPEKRGRNICNVRKEEGESPKVVRKKVELNVKLQPGVRPGASAPMRRRGGGWDIAIKGKGGR